jgi:hypothetical protein
MECWSKQAVGVIRGPKWPKEAQGLPWVDSSPDRALKRPRDTGIQDKPLD